MDELKSIVFSSARSTLNLSGNLNSVFKTTTFSTYHLLEENLTSDDDDDEDPMSTAMLFKSSELISNSNLFQIFKK